MKSPPKQAWEKISSFYKYRSMDEYYSILHKYVSTCEDLENPRARASVKSENEFSSPAALAFVDDGKLALWSTKEQNCFSSGPFSLIINTFF